LTMAKIPFNKPFIAGKELHYIAQAVTLGNIGGDGCFTAECSRLLEDQGGIHKVLMTPSCTAALEMAAMLCKLRPGDEVIVPSFTFVSTVNAFVRLGAKPVFVHIRPDTLNLDDNLIEEAITPQDGQIQRFTKPHTKPTLAIPLEPCAKTIGCTGRLLCAKATGVLQTIHMISRLSLCNG